MPHHRGFNPELIATMREAGPEVDERRRALLRGRHVLFVLGSYEGKRKMYQRVRELGVRMTVLDGPGHWSASAADLFDHTIALNLTERETLPERAVAAIRASGLQFDAVATFEESAGPLFADIASRLGLLGHPLHAIDAARHKAITREICRDAGIPTPRFARLRAASDLAKAAEEVGFPAVLKPGAGMSSVAVYRVNTPAELHERYAQNLAVAWRASTPKNSNDDDTELTWAEGTEMLLEEFLDGEEFDVDCLLCEGELVYAKLIRDLPMPHMSETGAQMPPNYPADRQAELVDLAREVLAAMGFRDGAFHIEVKYTSQGPRLIEVNARIGGGPTWELHKRVWGVDLVEQYLMVQLGIPIRPVPAPSPRVFCLTSDLPAHSTGIVTRTDFLDHLAGHPHVLAAYPRVAQGQLVVGPDTGVPEWLGEIIVQGESVAHAEAVMADILATVELPIQALAKQRGAVPLSAPL